MCAGSMRRYSVQNLPKGVEGRACAEQIATAQRRYLLDEEEQPEDGQVPDAFVQERGWERPRQVLAGSVQVCLVLREDVGELRIVRDPHRPGGA